MSITTDDRRGVSDRRIRRLRAAVSGVVITAEDAGYDDLRRATNAVAPDRPVAIVQVADSDDIVTALEFARSNRLSVSVRGGGLGTHGHPGAGVVVIDLTALRGVVVDRAARTATVRSGELGSGLDAATLPHGLAVPLGRHSLVGVTGVVLHGAAGWLSPRRGLACDNLISADVITADGRAVTASADENADLFWSLRGGGATGIVTSLTLKLDPVALLVHAGVQLFRPADATDVLAALDALHARDRDEFAGAAAVLPAPPAAFVPGNIVGHPVLAVVPAWLGDPAEGAAFTAPLRAVPRLADASGPMPYERLQTLFDRWPATGPRRACVTTTIHELTPTATHFEDMAPEVPAVGASVVVARLGGAIGRLAPDSSAVANRHAAWAACAAAQWSAPSEDEQHIAWTTDAATRLSPSAAVPPESTRDERLQSIRHAWDPSGVFASPSVPSKENRA